MAWYGVAVLACLVHVVRAGCPNTAGVVVGSIFGTLVVVAIVIGVIAFVYYRRNRKDKNKLTLSEQKLKERDGHTNPSFVEDVEMGRVNGKRRPDVNRSKDFPGYVECIEYQSPAKNRRVAQNGSGAARRFPLEDKASGAVARTRLIHKTGSSGSLDESYPAVDSNLIVVPLLSQDIMGLGFNVDGNMKEGIFVSKLHKRGPAHDTGLIVVGDRIMSVTVSFENMVLEDAMTILSYASPYPVKLCLQRASGGVSKASSSDVKEVDSREVEEVDINHPVYRSQSLDDLRQINKEGLLHPRRTWSEWKKAGYIPGKPMEEGRLKKWKGKTDIVEETSESGDLQTQSSTSNYSIPDLKIDISDLRMDSNDLDVPEIRVTEAEVTGEQKGDDETGEMSSSAVKVQAEISEAKPAVEPLDPDVSVSSNGLESQQNDGVEETDGDIEIGAASADVHIDIPVPTEKPPAIPDDNDYSDGKGTAELSLKEVTEASDDAKKTEEGGSVEAGSMGDVIRDYFSNSPTILQQFGLNASNNQETAVNAERSELPAEMESADGKATVATAQNDSEMAGSPDSGFMGTHPSGGDKAQKTSASSNSATSSSPESPSHGDEGVDVENDKNASLISRKVGDGLVFDLMSSGYKEIRKEAEAKPDMKSGPKGGLAYYVSIDDHGSPAHSIRPIAGVDLSTMDLGQPELIRPKPSSDSAVIEAPTSMNSYEATMAEPDTKVPTDENDNSQSLTDLKTNKLTVQLDGSSETINNLSSATGKDYKFDKSENVTIIKQNDIPEAFTVTLNREDSEA